MKLSELQVLFPNLTQHQLVQALEELSHIPADESEKGVVPFWMLSDTIMGDYGKKAGVWNPETKTFTPTQTLEGVVALKQ